MRARGRLIPAAHDLKLRPHAPVIGIVRAQFGAHHPRARGRHAARQPPRVGAHMREQIIEKAVVRGKVILSSGREADYYVDLRRVTLDGVAGPLVGRVMRELTEDWEYQAVGGLTLGADPVAADHRDLVNRHCTLSASQVLRPAKLA